MKSYKAQTNGLLLVASLAMALTPLSAFADKKSDLYAKGIKSMNAGGSQDVIDARDAFCQVKKDDPEYNDGTNANAQKLCDDMTAAANKLINLSKVRFGEASDLMAAGKYDEAENKFKTVKFGDYVPIAKQKIAEIAKLKLDKQTADAQNRNAADQASAINTKFEQGSAAFNSGNFEGAKAALNGITGSRAAEAQDILAKISNYENLMQQANNFAQAKNFNAAATFYNQAGGIKANGPGNPFAKAQEMNTQLVAAGSAPANANPPTNTAVPKPSLTAANKDTIEKVDENKLIQDAKQLIAKGKYPLARKLLNKVLAQNLKNKAAQDAMNSLPQEAPAATATATVTQEDPVLAAAIREFYKANYDDAETALGYYLAQGNKKGLGNFYIGVSLLTRYYLSGESDQSLKSKAVRRFSAAKDVAGFKAPEKMVSPKILAIYKEAKGSTAPVTP